MSTRHLIKMYIGRQQHSLHACIPFKIALFTKHSGYSCVTRTRSVLYIVCESKIIDFKSDSVLFQEQKWNIFVMMELSLPNLKFVWAKSTQFFNFIKCHALRSWPILVARWITIRRSHDLPTMHPYILILYILGQVRISLYIYVFLTTWKN